MIVASNFMVTYLKAIANLDHFAEKINVSRPTLYKVMEGEPVSNAVMSALIKESGFDMDKAFQVKDDN